MKKKLLSIAAATMTVLLAVSGMGMTAFAGESGSEYVIMNIPYGSFFEGEYEGGENIDVVSSATKMKSGQAGLVGGSYHTSDNGQILGVSFPVEVTDGITLDPALEVATTDDLFGAPDYSYVKLADAPEYYKVMTEEGGLYTFGKAVGEVKTGEYENAQISVDSRWGDYEVMIQGTSDATVFAGLLNTAEGNSYGIRVLENIWRGFEIGINTYDHTDTDPNSIVSYEPYATLPGQTITEIIYFTTEGMISYSVDLYVPVKVSGTITVDEANINDGQTKVTIEGYPEDFEAAYEITGAGQDMVCDGETITWASAFAGTYTLKVKDAAGKYVETSQEFVLSTDRTAAQAGTECIVKAEGATDEEFSAYISNITSVTVGDTEVGVFGFGAATLILGDGTVDKTKSSVFNEIGDYNLVIHSAGSDDVAISVHIDEVAEDESSGASGGGPGGESGGESAGEEGGSGGGSEGGEGGTN